MRLTVAPLAVAVAAAAVAQPASGPMLKPGTWTSTDQQAFYERWYGNQLRAMREEPLWRPGAAVSRLLVLPSFRPAVAVRIGQGRGGFAATVTTLSGTGGYAPGEIARRRVAPLPRDVLRRLDAAMSAARLWERSTEAGRDGEVRICTDGTQYVFERRGPGGYSIVTRHQCQLDGSLSAVIRSWLAAAPEVAESAYLPD